MLPVDSTNHELTNGVVPPNSETEILNVTATVMISNMCKEHCW